ncbi:MAG: ribonuclease T2 family protein [Bryobacteraceae bacterium]
MKPLLSFVLLAAASLPCAAQTPQFDYYLLTLSWSPEYCHGHTSSTQCASDKHFGFVVHGLWPEYKTGSGPQHCGSQPGLSNPASMLDIMPDLGLIQHEWTTHGTCSGLSPDQYFGLIRKAFSAVKQPTQLTSAKTQQTLSPRQVKQAFEQANPGLSDSELMINCASNYLQAVEICLTKGLQPMTCPAPRDCRASTIRVPPIH